MQDYSKKDSRKVVHNNGLEASQTLKPTREEGVLFVAHRSLSFAPSLPL